jgi:signal transduction histidine kinase
MTTFPSEPSSPARLTHHLPDPSILEEFAGVVAHELATPLAIIDTAAEMALRQVPESAHPGTPGDLRHLLEMIRRNTQLAELLLGRLGLARDVEAGTVHLDVEVVDVGRLVRESVDDLRTVVLSEHPVSVDVRPSQPVTADPTALREIVFNLLSNAAKYSGDGAAIEVVVRTLDGCVDITVRNHGTGVTPGDTDRVFEKYQRGDTQTPGVGLGLFISRGLARAHGGDLTVRPAEDVGSEFHLVLPNGGPGS